MKLTITKDQVIELIKAGLDSDDSPIAVTRGYEVVKLSLATNGNATLTLDKDTRPEPSPASKFPEARRSKTV